jgi:hypothetical protein
METTFGIPLKEQKAAEKALYERTDAWLTRKFKEEGDKVFDKITKPEHYNVGGIEPAEFMESLGIAEDYYAGNIIKYISRYKHKNQIEDVRKAKQYCKMLIDLLETSDANLAP